MKAYVYMETLGMWAVESALTALCGDVFSAPALPFHTCCAPLSPLPLPSPGPLPSVTVTERRSHLYLTCSVLSTPLSWFGICMHFFFKFLYCASFHSRPRVLEFLEFIRLFLCSPLIHSFATDSEGSWSVRLTALCVVDFIFTDWLWKLLPGRTECFPRCVFRVGRPSTPNLS